MIKGYVKLLLTHVNVLPGYDEKGLRKALPELLVSFLNFIFRRYSIDQSAVKIPFEGRIDDPKIGVWTSIKSILGHMFGEPLKPKIDHTIDIHSVKTTK